MKIHKPKVGDIIEDDYGTWKVTHVSAILTPFRKAGQDTKIEGYQLGLVKMKKLTEEEFMKAHNLVCQLQELGLNTSSVVMHMSMLAPDDPEPTTTQEEK